VQVRQGFLHVWGSSGAAAAEEAARQPPLLIPELDPDAEAAVLRDGSPTLTSGHKYVRDLPYGWDFLVENLVDPSHVNYAHHGIIGNRRVPLCEGCSIFGVVGEPASFTVLSLSFST
jgi:phenylpropionate dioxygenase-like ring-hydroxylating dioxygenase large terminal subunit